MKKNIIKTLTPRFNSIKPFTGLNYFKYSLDLHNINEPNGVNNKLFVSDINRYELDYLRLSYNKLKIDFYNINYPSKTRKFCQYKIDVNNNYYYKVGLVDTNICNEDDSQERIFDLIDEKIIFSDWMTDYVTNISALAVINHKLKYNIESKYSNVYVHQIRQLITKNKVLYNSPEGLYRNKSDYIIPGYVINQFNVKDDIYSINNINKNKIYSTKLNINDGIFQENREQYNYIHELHVEDENFIGYRDMLSFSIILE